VTCGCPFAEAIGRLNMAPRAWDLLSCPHETISASLKLVSEPLRQVHICTLSMSSVLGQDKQCSSQILFLLDTLDKRVWRETDVRNIPIGKESIDNALRKQPGSGGEPSAAEALAVMRCIIDWCAGDLASPQNARPFTASTEAACCMGPWTHYSAVPTLPGAGATMRRRPVSAVRSTPRHAASPRPCRSHPGRPAPTEPPARTPPADPPAV